MSDSSSQSRRGSNLRADTQMLDYGYDPSLSEGAVKPPVFLTSTFVFKTAAEGKRLFNVLGGREQGDKSTLGLVYSRFNNPNLEILEDRLVLHEKAEAGAVFASGMAAISALFWSLCRPGETILSTRPLYGGTEVLIDNVLSEFGIHSCELQEVMHYEEIAARADEVLARGSSIPLLFAESPANPTNALVNFQALEAVATHIAEQQGRRPLLVIDNTLLGPIYQSPLEHGFDLVVYSLTKYVGGHSDLVAGAVLGKAQPIAKIRDLRNKIGSQLDPHSGWMLLRSLETLSLRMEKANANARAIAEFLVTHKKVRNLNYLGFLDAEDHRHALYKRQCRAPGSTMSFELSEGGEEVAFRFLDSLHLIKLAVSLGGNESLISHPASTTHSGTAEARRRALGITESMVRLSVGIGDARDLIADLEGALGEV